MHRLEVYVVEFLQQCLLVEALDGSRANNRYIELENELILMTKGVDEKEIYLSTECNLQNMESSLMKYVRVIDNHYKVVWSDIFLYLVGEKLEKDLAPTILTNEIRMIRLSSKPLTNYLKSK